MKGKSYFINVCNILKTYSLIKTECIIISQGDRLDNKSDPLCNYFPDIYLFLLLSYQMYSNKLILNY